MAKSRLFALLLAASLGLTPSYAQIRKKLTMNFKQEELSSALRKLEKVVTRFCFPSKMSRATQSMGPLRTRSSRVYSRCS